MSTFISVKNVKISDLMSSVVNNRIVRGQTWSKILADSWFSRSKKNQMYVNSSISKKLDSLVVSCIT